MPRKRTGQFRGGVRQEANGTFTAKHGQRWDRGHPTRAAALEAKARLANDTAPAQQRRETVQDWFNRWLQVLPRPAETTNMYYRERLGPFVQEFGQRRVSKITHGELQEWCTQHPQRIRQVKVFFSDAHRLGVDGITSNPGRGITGEPSYDGRRYITPLTLQEVQRLAELAGEVHGAWGREVFGPMILTAAWTGLRPAELYGLEWRDIRWEEGDVHVRRQFRSKTRELVAHTKTGNRANPRDRFVPLSPDVTEALRLVPRRREFVFFSSREMSRFHAVMLQFYWNPVKLLFVQKLPKSHWLRQRIADAEQAKQQEPDGVKRGRMPTGQLDFYELRHFFASELYRRGVHIGDIARMLGHKDEGELAKTTYVHVHQDEARERVRRALWATEPEPVPLRKPAG